MSQLISIETKRYSEFFRRVLVAYGDNAAIRIDGQRMAAADALDHWCKNAVICETRDFVLMRNGVEVCGFHDHPSETWMIESELPFVERLVEERIVRARVS